MTMTLRWMVSSLFLCLFSFSTYSQSIINWTEQDGTLGLGYPVPIPVDTPEPFDGFRTYAGLFAKHQSIAQSSPYVRGHIVNQTHYERDIWAYVLSDDNELTQYGLPEGNMLINGGIHAREWQSPEVVTGVIELLNDHANDEFIYQYLLENTAIVAIPVNNVDGFLQTQRYPTENWFGTDLQFRNSPRDGRMRRKNMLNVDEVLTTQADHLLGVDLNRNNLPFWSTTAGNPNPRSSFDRTSLIYHGPAVHSEPETQARLNAAELINTDHLRVYTDVHSFSELFFSTRINNGNTNVLQSRLLLDFANHHAAFPAGKFYEEIPNLPGSGIGTTDEYFAYTYQIPSATLEIEPSSGDQNNPGGSADYGGFANNGNDGFILPESEIRRVREQLAQSFAVMWYGQAGPPSITRVQIVEAATHNIIQDFEWDVVDSTQRTLFINDVENLIAGESYHIIVSFDKPMRMRTNQGRTVNLQGQSIALSPSITASIDDNPVAINFTNGQWLDEQLNSWRSYQQYKKDTYVANFTVPESAAGEIVWSISAADMIGQLNDANPATVSLWAEGRWSNYENAAGIAGNLGGSDNHYSSTISTAARSQYPPQVGGSAMYYDINRSGEGFTTENLSDQRASVQFFTYDDRGGQQWFVRAGERQGNRIVVNNIIRTTGGFFGSALDPTAIQRIPVGQVEMTFSNGTFVDTPVPRIDRTAEMKYTALDGTKLRTQLTQLTQVQGLFDRVPTPGVPNEDLITRAGEFSATWYDIDRSGEGYILQVLTDGRAILAWYTYTPDGQQMWLIDSSGEVTETLQGITIDFNNLIITSGTVFGEDFDADDVVRTPWGTARMELNCSGGSFSFNPVIDGYEAGTHTLTRLTRPEGLFCSP